MSIEKLREHAAWSKRLEERCRPHVPEMTDASFRRLVGIIVDLEAHERRHQRRVVGHFIPRAFETPDGHPRVLDDTEVATLVAGVHECMNERYGEMPSPLKADVILVGDAG